MSLFALPVVGRAGLGNALFPWARAELFARRSGARVLAPYWPGFRLGPYVRREPEKRHYSAFFRAAHHSFGFSRFAVGALGQRISERQLNCISTDIAQRYWPCIVEFSGIVDLFAPLLGEHNFIRKQLWNMTKGRLRSRGEQYGGLFIAFHVRRGDITRQGFTRDQLKQVNQYTPISWFISMARAVRCEEAYRSTPIIIFTDGSPEEVAEICAIEGVHLHQRRQAIMDLWTLTHAKLLFASGFSTFGMWASFLNGMPTIYAPGKIQQFVQTGRENALEIELAEDEHIPANVVASIEKNSGSVLIGE
jgi:hypothetical protein